MERTCSVVDQSKIDHPSHYGGKENPYEVIKLVESWGLGFKLGNALKYILRAGRKDRESMETDLHKALWYIKRHWSHGDLLPEIKTDNWIDPEEACRAWDLGKDLSLMVMAIACHRLGLTHEIVVPFHDGDPVGIQQRDLLAMSVVRVESFLAGERTLV